MWSAIEGCDRSLVSILMSCDLRSSPRSTDTILSVLETRSTETRYMYDRGDGAAQPMRATCMHIFIRRLKSRKFSAE
eukprot:COSAG05_NODE_984_length_6299_cov_4.250323_2_plen_77_part_00